MEKGGKSDKSILMFGDDGGSGGTLGKRGKNAKLEKAGKVDKLITDMDVPKAVLKPGAKAKTAAAKAKAKKKELRFDTFIHKVLKQVGVFLRRERCSSRWEFFGGGNTVRKQVGVFLGRERGNRVRKQVGVFLGGNGGTGCANVQTGVGGTRNGLCSNRGYVQTGVGGTSYVQTEERVMFKQGWGERVMFKQGSWRNGLCSNSGRRDLQQTGYVQTGVVHLVEDQVVHYAVDGPSCSWTLLHARSWTLLHGGPVHLVGPQLDPPPWWTRSFSGEVDDMVMDSNPPRSCTRSWV